MRSALLTVVRRWGGYIFDGLVLSGLASSGVSPHDVGLKGSRNPMAGDGSTAPEESPPAREPGPVS